MRAWLVYNHSLNYEKFQEVHDLYVKAGDKLGIIIDLVANNEIISIIEQGSRELLCNHVYPDFVIFLDKDLYLGEQLEALGLPIFNKTESIGLCDDKAKTMARLSDYDIPIPKTIMAPLSFSYTENRNFLKMVAHALSLPCIIKESFGSFGEQVYLVETMEELKSVSRNITTKPHIYQEFISTSRGKDLRVYVAFGEVILTVKRSNLQDFRANVSNGGIMEVYEPSPLMKAVAIESTKALELDFAGVDILFGEGEIPIVCEVNSNAHIKYAYDVTGINFAEAILRGIVNTLQK